MCIVCGVCAYALRVYFSVTAELALDAIHDAFHGNSRVG